MQKRFPKLETEIDDAFVAFVSNSAGQNSVVGQIRSHRLFEGSGSSIVRENELREETEFHSFSSELKIDTKVILYGRLSDLIETFRPLAMQMASEKERMLFEVMRNATEKTGNIVSAEGKPISIEKIFEVLEKIQIEFDQNGQPRMPTMVVGSEIAAQIEKMMDDSTADDHQKRFDNLIQRKKAEWLAREADRTLVG